MAKAPSESRIPTFNSKIPKPGKFRFLPTSLHNYQTEETENPQENARRVTSIKYGSGIRQPGIRTTACTTDYQNKLKLDTTHTINTYTNSTVILSGKDNMENDGKGDTTGATVVLDSNKVEATFIQNQTYNVPQFVKNITGNDIGRKICINNVQTGVLKYVGSVQFNAGLWCGVELDEPVGKHDGCVKGVRYFSCRAGCGIMAPVDIITFIDPTTEDNSGPYSLIGIETCSNDKTFQVLNESELQNRTLVLQPIDQDLAVNPEAVKNRRLTQIIERSDDNSSPDKKNERRSIVISHSLGYNSFSDETKNIRYNFGKTASTPIHKERNKRKSADDTMDNTISPDVSIKPGFFCNANKKFATPINSPAETPSFPKQNSFEMDESSLGILTPDQMKDFSPLVVGSKTPSSDDLKSLIASNPSDKTISNSRTPSSENLGSLPHDGFKQPPPLSSLSSEFTVQNSIVTRPDSIQLKQDSCKSTKVVDIPSPNLVDQSTMDFSLGLIDEDMLISGTHFTSNLETTTNLDLPLDPIHLDGKLEDLKTIPRCDQTPSPEDLPLDPIDPIDLNDDPKIDLLEPTSSNPSTESDVKTDQSSKSNTNTKTNSFITSITSITSLDTGYQGDGEMSRPASRGADHSPVAHKPNNPTVVNLNWQRAIARRQDPMTDSDFFTESDADGHDETAPRGDRRAQVIDGTLYGANPQAAAAAADIYINNHEEMDSSGIFTDLDTNPRTDDFSDGERNKEPNENNDDKSPSDASTKTISENSQELKEVVDLDTTLVNQTLPEEFIQDTTVISNETVKSPTQSVASNPGSRKSPRNRASLPKEESPNKKIKMPKRNVVSKVKTMMETTKSVDSVNQESRKPPRKTVNRWDAVMNKISKGEDDKSKLRLSQVKSKVATSIAGNTTSKRTDNVKTEDATKPKIRRVRARNDNILSKTNSRTTSSIHSSISDLSVGISPPKTTSTPSVVNRSAKKRDVARCATPVTEVLTPAAAKHAITVSPRSTNRQQNASITRELKKSPVPAPIIPDGKTAVGRRTPSRRTQGAVKTPNKDQSRVTGTTPHKGGSPVHPQVLQERAQTEKLLPHVKHSAKGVEALGVLVQYLVFNLDAFRTPTLKRELEQVKSKWLKDKLDLEETRMGYRRLEDAISDQKEFAATTIEQERIQFRAEITELFEKHRRELSEINDRHIQEKLNLESRYQEEVSELKSQLDDELNNRENEISIRLEAYADEQRYKFQEVELKNERLKQEHQITLEILREENDSIRDQLEEKNLVIEDLEKLRFLNEKLKCEFSDKERYYEEKIANAEDEVALLKEENRKILETFKSDTKDNKLQNGTDSNTVVPQAALGRCTQLQDEVESLRSVLELKLEELSDLRRAHGELSQAADELPGALVRCQTLQARVEDLEMQLARKTEIELQLTKENKRLQETCNQETKQKKRLSLYNEELQWKLKQNSEVVNAILQGQTPTRKSLHGSNQSLCDDVPCKTPSGGYLSRSLHTSSFNEKHYGTPHVFERTLSFRERSSQCYKETSPKNSTSPRNDSKSRSSDYFDMDDSPPSSPKVKGVVEKSDSVSWVLDMDESPEVLASRMVRRAGSFRNVTPPKSTPTKSPATKRPRTKSNNLSLSASAGTIGSPNGKNDNRHRSKSVTLRDSQSPESCHPGEYLSNSWHYSLRTSTPTKPGLETIRSVKLENNPDLEHDTDVAISLPALPSEISRKSDKPDSLPSLPSGDLMLMQSSFPKSSAGEAMISESNSEDECSSSTGERSPSVSDTETSEEPTGDKCLEKHSKMQYDLFLMTESTTNSEIMDCSWSEELDA